MNRRQRIRYRFWRHAGDPRVWATVGAILLVASSLLSCYAVYEVKRSTRVQIDRIERTDCRQRTEGRAAARALAVAVVDELTKPPATVSPEVKADYIERTRRRALKVLPPPDC